MSIIRTPEQTKLAELHAIGAGMLVRYSALQEQDSEALIGIIENVVDRRGRLLDAVAAASKRRGDIPPAGDHEANELRALVDRFTAKLFGEDSLHERILGAEASWLEALDDARGMNWEGDEQSVLHALREESRRTIAALDAIGG